MPSPVVLNLGFRPPLKVTRYVHHRYLVVAKAFVLFFEFVLALVLYVRAQRAHTCHCTRVVQRAECKIQYIKWKCQSEVQVPKTAL